MDNDLTDALRTVPILANVGEEMIAQLAARCRRGEVSAGARPVSRRRDRGKPRTSSCPETSASRVPEPGIRRCMSPCVGLATASGKCP